MSELEVRKLAERAARAYVDLVGPSGLDDLTQAAHLVGRHVLRRGRIRGDADAARGYLYAAMVKGVYASAVKMAAAVPLTVPRNRVRALADFGRASVRDLSDVARREDPADEVLDDLRRRAALGLALRAEVGCPIARRVLIDGEEPAAVAAEEGLPVRVVYSRTKRAKVRLRESTLLRRAWRRWNEEA